MSRKLPKNKQVIITILDDDETGSITNPNEALKIFKDICYRLKDDSEELTEEFDNILSSGFNIERRIDV